MGKGFVLPTVYPDPLNIPKVPYPVVKKSPLALLNSTPLILGGPPQGGFN